MLYNTKAGDGCDACEGKPKKSLADLMQRRLWRLCSLCKRCFWVNKFS